MSSVPPGKTSHEVPRTRAAGVWIASILFALILLLLLIFILQNTQPAEISFFGIHANPPVGVALLLAAVFGVLLVAVPGTARIVQLRILARRRGQTVAPAEVTDAPPAIGAAPGYAPPTAPPGPVAPPGVTAQSPSAAGLPPGAGPPPVADGVPGPRAIDDYRPSAGA